MQEEDGFSTQSNFSTPHPRVTDHATQRTRRESRVAQARALPLPMSQKPRSLSEFRSLLERIRQLDQNRLAPSPPKKRNPHRQAIAESRNNVNVGISGHRRKLRATSAKRVAIHDVR